MPRENPFFKKCCFCIPLQSCLQTWACLKAFADLSLAVFLTFSVLILAGYHELGTDHFSVAHLLLIAIIALLVDSVFMVVLTVGLCTGNVRTLQVFFYYSIYMVLMGAACLIGFLVYAILNFFGTSDQGLSICLIACGLINMGLDICIILTLKSEMIKLRNKQQYEFVQMPTLENFSIADPAEPFQADAENLHT